MDDMREFYPQLRVVVVVIVMARDADNDTEYEDEIFELKYTIFVLSGRR